MAFPSKSKKCPDPGRNLHVSYRTAEPYSDTEHNVQSHRTGNNESPFEQPKRPIQTYKLNKYIDFNNTICSLIFVIQLLPTKSFQNTTTIPAKHPLTKKTQSTGITFFGNFLNRSLGLFRH